MDSTFKKAKSLYAAILLNSLHFSLLSADIIDKTTSVGNGVSASFESGERFSFPCLQRRAIYE